MKNFKGRSQECAQGCCPNVDKTPFTSDQNYMFFIGFE